jgi:hypothetical protein
MITVTDAVDMMKRRAVINANGSLLQNAGVRHRYRRHGDPNAGRNARVHRAACLWFDGAVSVQPRFLAVHSQYMVVPGVADASVLDGGC